MNEPPPQLPEVKDVLVSTTVSLVNLAGIRLTEKEHRNVAEAKEAIDAARALLPLCPEETIGPVKDALSQVQMLYVREERVGAHSAEPSASATGEAGEPPTEAGEQATEAQERAEARSKIWTPPGT